MTVLVWFRRDLRLSDNPAFDAALRSGNKILPVYVHAPEEERWQPGAASRWYLHQSLTSLQKDLALMGLPLVTLRSPSRQGILALLRRYCGTAVYWNEIYEPDISERDTSIRGGLASSGYEVEVFHDHSLFPPGSIKNGAGNTYRVFTPFWKALSRVMVSQSGSFTSKRPLNAGTQSVRVGSSQEGEESIGSLGLLDEYPWHEKLHAHWTPGEKSALDALRAAYDHLDSYPEGRDFPGSRLTSSLSAALHFGEIAPWRVVEEMWPAFCGELGASSASGAEAFLRQIAWREFSIHLLSEYPETVDTPMNPKFADGRVWFEDSEKLQYWQKGETGIPLVDAGMAELWETGWMHNRTRMVVASFLTKNLGQHWIHGARWFWDTLVDADLANNTMGWQWVAGCGCDAAPYYRIFNPHTQAKRFDPKGEYIERWLEPNCLNSPITDLKASRESALDRYKKLR